MTAAPAKLELPTFLVERAVAAALEEDLGLAGDITTNAIIPVSASAEAEIVARKPGVIAGLDLAAASFKRLDPDAQFVADVADGTPVAARTRIARIQGKTRALLSAERVALNFLGRLSGIATLTAAYVAAVGGTKAKITCTRKTTPGRRALEKYAVRAGGGMNHRFGLYDAVLVKDNHIAAAGGLAPALTKLRARTGHLVKIEVEVDTLDQLDEARRDGSVRRRDVGDSSQDCGDWRRPDLGRLAYSLGAGPRLSARVGLTGATVGPVEASDRTPVSVFEDSGIGPLEASSTI